MKIILVRSVLFFAAVYCFIAANYNNTNSNLFGDNNSVSPSTNAVKYVTPHGTGDHSGSSWTNAYSFKDMQDKLTSNTSYYLIDSTFVVDSIFISNLSGLSFIGKGKTKTILQGQSNPFDDDPYLWSIKGFDLENADNITIKDIQIRKFRGFGIRVDAASSYFYAYNDSIVNCGWAAVENDTLVIAAPSGVKLLGDDATFRRCYVMYSGWDGMQVGAYRIVIDSTIIYATGQDPNVISQGDGIGAVVNKDSSYYVHINETDSVIVYKSAQFTVTNSEINTVYPIKSGIEAGEKDSSKHSEKPLVQIYNCKITGGKGVGITQDAHPRVGHFYSSIQGSKIKSLDPERPTCRIDSADPSPYNTPSWGSIKNNTFYSPEGYNPFVGKDCPVGEFYTDSTAVLYLNNTWIKADTLTDFCVKHNAE
ncbi:MAG: hypothetical protein IPH11_06225 [Ignavibacteriales bacterium]|nr:hypothetical protein [Ignavibacteriales bacterium]